MALQGTVLDGKFRAECPLAEGGMGTVWRGVDLRTSHVVAIKFLEASGEESEREDQVRRFLREARVASAVRHQNVVEMLDFGIAEGLPYLVMEMLDGMSLADRVDRLGPLTPSEACDVVDQALLGLEAVHAAGIVHRDLKPDNVFLSSVAGRSVAKLVDFGISRRLVHTEGVTFVTKTGMILGTPHYMAPEQARGARQFDHRVDVYSMGVILYEALTGALPFDAENIADLLTRIWTEAAKPASDLRSDLAGPTTELLAKALAKVPTSRFQTARDMREALARIAPSLRGLPAAARRGRVDERTLDVADGQTTDLQASVTDRPPEGEARAAHHTTDRNAPASAPSRTEPVPQPRVRADTDLDSFGLEPTEMQAVTALRAAHAAAERRGAIAAPGPRPGAVAAGARAAAPSPAPAAIAAIAAPTPQSAPVGTAQAPRAGDGRDRALTEPGGYFVDRSPTGSAASRAEPPAPPLQTRSAARSPDSASAGTPRAVAAPPRFSGPPAVAAAPAPVAGRDSAPEAPRRRVAVEVPRGASPRDEEGEDSTFIVPRRGERTVPLWAAVVAAIVLAAAAAALVRIL